MWNSFLVKVVNSINIGLDFDIINVIIYSKTKKTRNENIKPKYKQV